MNILLTPTGARPQAFPLCEKYFGHQTLAPDLWIVIDDCDPPTNCTMGQTVLRPEPRWPLYGEQNSQHRNILAALDWMAANLYWTPQDAIIIGEDEDFYSPDYIEKQVARLKDAALVGEIPARYYHVGHRAARVFEPTPHASLAATALRHEMLPLLREACECRAWIDVYLWKNARKFHPLKQLYEDTSVVGIKGMPGRPGVSAAHRNPTADDDRWRSDQDMSILRSWIGDDAEAYRKYGEPAKAPEMKHVDYSAANEEYGFKTFLSDSQTRYRCPECSYDHYDPDQVETHFIEVHKGGVQGAPPVTLFDHEGKQITRKIVVGNG